MILQIALRLRQRSPAGTIFVGIWVSIRVRRVGPLMEGRGAAYPGGPGLWLQRRCCAEDPWIRAGAAGGAPERKVGE
jgi:hypothetical protein